MIPDQKVKVKWVGYTKKYYINLGYNFTKMLDEFEIDIKDLPLKSNLSVMFICDYCNGANQKDISDQYAIYSNLMRNKDKNNKDACKYCAGKKLSDTLSKAKVTPEDTLVHRTPQLLSEWDYDKNKKSPLDFRYTHHYALIWWKCCKGHEWQDTIYNRSYKSFKCPFCSGRIVTEENCLANEYPHLMKEWHPIKNKKISPFEVAANSSKYAWWVGKCGHEWKTQIRQRSINKSGCPYCCGNKVCIDNCLQTINPKLAREWHPENNGKLTPKDVTSSSTKKVWWICKKCKYEWTATVSSRKNKNGCPLCKESTGEKEVSKFLNKYSIKYRIQMMFSDLKGTGDGYLKFDFGIFVNDKLKMLIEYDGEFHFYKIHKNHSLEYTSTHDKIKDRYCIDNDIPLIRIPYWDFNNMEDILLNVFYHYGILNNKPKHEIPVDDYLVNSTNWSRSKYKERFNVQIAFHK